jgi:hypothetical protein
MQSQSTWLYVSTDGTRELAWYFFDILKLNDCGSYSGFSDHRSKQENGVVHSVEMKPLKDVYMDTQKSSEDNTISYNHCKFDSPKHDDVSYAFFLY